MSWHLYTFIKRRGEQSILFKDPGEQQKGWHLKWVLTKLSKESNMNKAWSFEIKQYVIGSEGN